MENLHEQLIRDEGMVLKPYRDHLGYLTIGVGHCLDKKPISKRAALVMLDDDIADARADLLAKWPWMRDLSPARLGAFINLAFNMGVGNEAAGTGLAGFKQTMRAAAEGRWEDVAQGLLDSKYATQVGPRAHRVARQLREDRWV
jgi:lysozyme